MRPTTNLNVTTGPLTGDELLRVESAKISKYDPVFTGGWESDLSGPRFGDLRWQIAGLQSEGRVRKSWVIDFTNDPIAVTPEWSLIIREMLFWRANPNQARTFMKIPINWKTHGVAALKAPTVDNWVDALSWIADAANQLQIGLPHQWNRRQLGLLRDHVREHRPWTLIGDMVKMLHEMRDGLTLGGLQHKPLRKQLNTAQWAGDTAADRVAVATAALDPLVFQQVVGNALFYVMTPGVVEDILGGQQELGELTPKPSGRSQSRKSHPVSQITPASQSRSVWRVHQSIEELGGIPTATVESKSHASDGEPCLATMLRVARSGYLGPNGVWLPSNAVRRWWKEKCEVDSRRVAGGLPLSVSTVMRPDGTEGPWRDPFCYQSVALEVQTLFDACIVAILAFTSMRDGELAHIPAQGWLTEWHGAPAVVSQLGKGENGDSAKWWITPVVQRACEILELLAAPGQKYLTETAGSCVRRNSARNEASKHWVSIQRFVRRMNTDPHLHGLHGIEAGWGVHAGRPKNDTLPNISPQHFRVTLASISNFVAIGDVAFQKQAKHAQITMTHSYQQNPGNGSWTEILNLDLHRKLQQRTALVMDLVIGQWKQDEELAGHAGRAKAREIRDLLESLKVKGYDADSGLSDVEQFQTVVESEQGLLDYIRSQVHIVRPGIMAHCVYYLPTAECGKSPEPNQGQCFVEFCVNVLLQGDQQDFLRERDQYLAGLQAVPNTGDNQRLAIQESRANLQRQLGGPPQDEPEDVDLTDSISQEQEQ